MVSPSRACLKQALVDQKWWGCLESVSAWKDNSHLEDRVFPTEAKLAQGSLGRRSGQQSVDTWLVPAFLLCDLESVDSPLQPLQENASGILDSISQTLERLRIDTQRGNLGPHKWPRGPVLLLEYTMVPDLEVI